MKWLDLYRRQNKLINEQPFSWPEMTPQDWLMEAVSLIGLLSMIGYIAYYYHKLPATVPLHFDAGGRPGDSGDRLTIWVIPAITLLMHIIVPFKQKLSALAGSSRFLRMVRTQSQFNARIRLFRYNKMVVTWGFFYISVSITKVAMNTGQGLGTWFLWVFITLLIAPLLFYTFYVKQNH